MKTRILILTCTLLLGACAGITPAEFTQAQTDGQNVAALAEKAFPKDATAIGILWQVVDDLGAGIVTTPTTTAVLASLPPGTSPAAAQAAVTTAIAILGTPGAPAAARNGTLRQFCRTHQIEPLKPRIQGNPPLHIATWDMTQVTLYSANGDAVPSLSAHVAHR